MIVQCTVLEVQIQKKPKLKNVVRNIRLIFIKDFFSVLWKYKQKNMRGKQAAIQELHNPVSISMHANSCTLLELPATPQNSLEQLLFINNTAYLTRTQL